MITLTFTWSWLSFALGFITPIVLILLWAIVFAVKQANKNKKKAAGSWDSTDKLFQQWAGRNNN